MIGGRRLPREEERPRWQVELGIVADPVIQHDHAKRIEQLSLVFVDAFDLAVENGVRIDALARGGFEPVRKFHLRFALGRAKGLLKVDVVGQGFELAQLAKLRNPAIADGLGDGAGQRWIGE